MKEMNNTFNEVIGMLQEVQIIYRITDTLFETEAFKEMMAQPISAFGTVWCTALEEYCVANDMNSKEVAEELLLMVQRVYDEKGPAKGWAKEEHTYEFDNVKVRFKAAKEED